MSDNQGWISLHRKILDNPISNKPEYAWLWTMLLLLANHKENTFIWNNEEIIIRKGQLLTGRKELSKKTGISESKVYRILKYLENVQQIEQQKTTKFTIITITNWNVYQNTEQQIEQQVNNKRTTSEQQVNTNNNDNNEDNDNNENKKKRTQQKIKEIKFSKVEDITQDVLQELADKYEVPISLVEDSWDSAINWIESGGKKKKNYKSFLANWVKREKEKWLKEQMRNKSYGGRGGFVDARNI